MVVRECDEFDDDYLDRNDDVSIDSSWCYDDDGTFEVRGRLRERHRELPLVRRQLRDRVDVLHELPRGVPVRRRRVRQFRRAACAGRRRRRSRPRRRPRSRRRLRTRTARPRASAAAATFTWTRAGGPASCSRAGRSRSSSAPPRCGPSTASRRARACAWATTSTTSRVAPVRLGTLARARALDPRRRGLTPRPPRFSRLSPPLRARARRRRVRAAPQATARRTTAPRATRTRTRRPGHALLVRRGDGGGVQHRSGRERRLQ